MSNAFKASRKVNDTLMKILQKYVGEDYFIHSYCGRHEIRKIVRPGSGESKETSPMATGEMEAWLRGALFAFDHGKQGNKLERERCICGMPLPRVSDSETPYEFCSVKCHKASLKLLKGIFGETP